MRRTCPCPKEREWERAYGRRARAKNDERMGGTWNDGVSVYEVSGRCARSKERVIQQDSSALRIARSIEPSRCRIVHTLKDCYNLHGSCIKNAIVLVRTRAKASVQIAMVLVHVSDGYVRKKTTWPRKNNLYLASVSLVVRKILQIHNVLGQGLQAQGKLPQHHGLSNHPRRKWFLHCSRKAT